MKYEEIHLKKDEIHKKIDDSFSNILKSMGIIFDTVKLNEEIEETNNLEILTATESISSRLNELVRIVYDLKVEYLKKNEYDYNAKKRYQSDITKNSKEIGSKMNQLQENYNHINSLLKENKLNKYYKYSLNYNID
jgi:hypothetical protein